jgi:hypothetical protein
MLFDRPSTRSRTAYGSFDLVTWSTTLKVRVVSNHSVLPIGHDSILPCNGSVLLSLLFGQLLRNYVCALLLWGLLLISTPGLQLKCAVCQICLLTSKSALRSCLRIHLVCLTAIKSNLFGRQDCLKRCRGGHPCELIHLLGFH